MKKEIKILGKTIGDGYPSFLIAEIGSNHNRDKEVVFQLIDATAKAGFDAVKFQIYDAEEAFSKNEMTTDVGLEYLYGVRPWWEIARDKILMPREWFGEMFEYARKKKLIPLSAIHRVEDCKFLLQYGLPAIKIASIDFTYFQLLEELSKFKLPMIISSGMANEIEIDNTIKFLEEQKKEDIALLHCSSCYPPKEEELNLNNIINFKNKYKIPVGYSDHYSGKLSSSLAVGLGANIIEKHITLDKKFPGPDHPFAIEPTEMIEMVRDIRNIEKMKGSFSRKLSHKEIENKKMIRRSVVAKVDININETITLNKIKFARPGTGVQTYEFEEIKNKKVKKKICAETVITHEMIEK